MTWLPELPINSHTFGLLTFFFRWRQQSRAGAQYAAIGPLAVAPRAGFVLGRGSGGARRAFAKEDFPDARLLMEPARQQTEMIFEFAIALLRRRSPCGK